MITGRQIRLTVLSILLVLTSILALLGSQPGVQLARALAPTLLPGLSIGHSSGDWWRGLTLTDVQYQQANLSVQLKEVRLAIDYSCLWQQQICLSQLQLNEPTLQIGLTEHADSDRPAATKPATEQAVWLLKIPQLEAEQLQLKLPAGTIKLASLQTAMQVGLATVPAVELHSSRLRQLVITLPAATQPAAALHNPLAELRNPLAELRNPLVELLALPLPVTFKSTDFSLQQLTIMPPAATTVVQLTQLNWQQIAIAADRWQVSELLARLPVPAPIQTLLAQVGAAQVEPASAAGPQAQRPNDAAITLQTDVVLPKAPTAPASLSLRLQHPQFQFQLQGAGLLTQWPVTARLQLHNNRTKAASNSSPVATEALLTAQGKLNLLASQLPFELALSAEQLQWHNASLTDFTASLTGDLAQQQLQLKSLLHSSQLPSIAVELQAELNETQLQWPRLSLQTLNGELQSSGTLDLKQRTLQSRLQLDNLQPGLYWPDYPGTVSGSTSIHARFDNTTQASLAMPDLLLSGDLRGLPLSLEADWLLVQGPQGWQLTTHSTSLQHGPNQLTASGQVGEQWQLQAKLQLIDLSYSLPQAEGSLDGDIAISGDLTAPDVQLRLQGRQLSYLDDYALGQLALSANIRHLGSKASEISLSAQNGQAPGLQLQQLQWQLDGSLQQHHSHLAIDSHQLQLASTVTGVLTPSSWQLAVAELRLKSDFGDWQLASPTQLDWLRATQQLRLQPLCMLELQSALCLRTQQLLSQQRGELALGLGNLSLADVSALLPDNVSLAGQLSGELALRWDKGRLDTLAFDLSSPEGLVRHQLTTAIDLPFSQLKSRGTLSAHTLDAGLSAMLQQDSPLSARVVLSKLDSASPQLSASVQIKPLALKFLQAALTELQQFDGKLAAELRAEGALDNPAIYGHLALDQLHLSGPQVPVELTSANLLASFNGFQASLNSRWQTPEGQLEWSGQANWLQPSQWFVEMAVVGNKLHTQLLDSELVVSPDLRFTASPHSGEIRGNINVPSGHIRFNSLPESATAVSSDEVIVAANQAVQGKTTWRLNSDIRLHIDDEVRLSAFGLNTRLHGDLRIRQQDLLPTLHGQVQLKDGQFRAYGQDLKLRRGKLTFNGPANQPLLAIEAIRNPEKTEDEVIAGLRVNGLADDPVVQVFSEPAKPQANALAYLLLGRDIGSSAGDGAVTTGLIGIGIANTGKLVGSIGEAFGISDLSLDTAGSGDKSKVTVSGYLSPRLQVKYGVGIFSQFGEFTLRYRLMKQLYVEAVQGLATSVDVLYKMEFD
jgi:translocation and assembly module TamB